MIFFYNSISVTLSKLNFKIQKLIFSSAMFFDDKNRFIFLYFPKLKKNWNLKISLERVYFKILLLIHVLEEFFKKSLSFYS